MKNEVIKLDNKHSYLYSNSHKMFMLYKNGRKDDFFVEDGITFKTDYSSEAIKMNLANLRQLLIEVTDTCNLQCKYCGYGDLYANYDKREAKLQQFANVKLLIDHLSDLWRSEYNTSYNKNITVGFYGGEPLMNMRLIKETIAYLESLQDVNVSFSYNMTTNGVLLDRYMDFLVEKSFKLLFSLDGNEYNSGYRVDKQGKGSYSKVFTNIKLMQSTYPDFFDKNVNFNAVLHDRNSVEDVFAFIKQEFGKTPRVAELQEENRMEDSASTFFHTFVRDFTGNYYNSYIDLFDSEDSTTYIPTGTCRPFERKIFLTVNGKILPCEKMGQNHVLGTLKDGILDLDYERVGAYYHDLYEKVIKNCKTCFLQKACGQCMFLLEEKDGKLVCPGYMGKNRSADYFARYLSYAEEHPDLYEFVMSNIAVD